ncbi:MAG: 1-acyl-sn-glycerol-3-phosphate acyltransferase, partial [Firmicutes bacterium]|nr:1-acyl-sn-glycerol-3-phosphate acyltransferase [Bacillota bacterium]
MKAVCRFLSLFLYPRKIIHPERIPKKAKYVGVGNHQHWVDIVYIFIRGRGGIKMVAKKELQEKSGFLRVMHKEIGIIFVDRDNPSLASI